MFNCVDVLEVITAYRAERSKTLGVHEVVLTPKTQFSLAIAKS